MLFQTYGDRRNPAVLFFHAMGVTGASSEPIARYLQDRYFCVLPTSTVYCEGQKYVSKLDEIRQVEDFLHRQGVERLAMVVASSIGADLAMAFLTQTKLPVEHAFFDGGQFAQIGKGTRRIMTPFLYFGQRRLLLPFLLKLQYFLKELTIIFVSQLLFSFQGTSLSVLFRALKIEQYLLCLYLSPVPDGRPSLMFFHLPDSLERR